MISAVAAPCWTRPDPRPRPCLQHQGEVVLGTRETLVGRPPVPTSRHGLVAHDSFAGLVRQPEVVLGFRDSALRRLATPENRLKGIRLGAVAGGDHVTDVELGHGEPLVGCATVELEGLGRVRRKPVAGLMQRGEVENRGGVAQRDGTFIESNRLRNVFRHSFTPEQRVTEGRQRRRIPEVGPSAQRGQILRLRPDSRRPSRDHQRSRHQGA